ncbi:MAG: dihydrofolate reductase [Lachnospiraceae bacterium]|nr:dihydrofolate reductase [Lachnospiraceae bacterium]
MNQIVAVDSNWGIGKDGRLLISIPEDMKFFRTMTQGKTVIMGRKTLESFPGGKPLKGRRNIVLTRQPDIDLKGAERAGSVEEALAMVKDEDSVNVFVIGGSSIYEAFLPYCDTCYVTKIGRAYPADSRYPDLEAEDEWEADKESAEMLWEDIPYRFVTYKKRFKTN